MSDTQEQQLSTEDLRQLLQDMALDPDTHAAVERLLAVTLGSEAKALRLSLLGWTHEEIGKALGVDRSAISKDVKKFSSEEFNKTLGVTKSQAHRDSQKFSSEEMGKTLGPSWNDKRLADVANL